MSSKWAIQFPHSGEPVDEFVGQIIDVFEDFLSEGEDPELVGAILTGKKYDDLKDNIEGMLWEWDLIDPVHKMVCGMEDGCDGCFLKSAGDIERCKNMKW